MTRDYRFLGSPRTAIFGFQTKHGRDFTADRRCNSKSPVKWVPGISFGKPAEVQFVSCIPIDSVSSRRYLRTGSFSYDCYLRMILFDSVVLLSLFAAFPCGGDPL